MEPEKKEQEEQEVKEENNEPTLADSLSEFPGAPNEEDIESWKQKFGEVFASGFTPTELFIWRPISRKEFIALQIELSQDENATQWDLEEKLVEKCLLWATPIALDSLEKKAGSLSTLQEQIMQRSNFTNPAMAASIVIKL